MIAEAPLLQVNNLVHEYSMPREKLFGPVPKVHALNGVSFIIDAGRSLGIVGESGSGKSTLARLVMALEQPTAGSVKLMGRDLHSMPAEELREARRDFQMVFQDPYGSLDPRQTVERIVGEPLAAQRNTTRAEQRKQAAAVLESVGLREGDMDKYPHEFSGGQRQRIAIARALITRPKLIVADEPVSALDVSVQAQVLNLLQDLQQQFGVTYLLISHDLAVVDHVCDEVAVMYAGRVVEHGTPEQLFGAAAHPYTQALVAALPQAVAGVPHAMHTRQAENGTAPAARPAVAPDSPASIRVWPDDAVRGGCSFAERCSQRRERCVSEAPSLRVVAGGQQAACHFA